jgi:tetratricopeptide (TPR) repeat protein
MKPFVLIAVVVFTGLAVAERSWGQNANLRRLQQQQKEMQRRMEQQMREAAAAQPDLPSDPELLLLHKEFITRAEKLAAEYERKKQYDKAREVFEAMTRLLPKYQEAQAGLQRMLKAQSMQDRKLTEVQAAAGWQDSGATLVKGIPVRVDVKGTWSVVVETGPEGVQIPNDLKPRDSKIRLGTLVGVIASSSAELEKAEPFPIKPGDDFVAKENGRLFLRMFDIDPSDNQGKLYVLIQSTFGK